MISICYYLGTQGIIVTHHKAPRNELKAMFDQGPGLNARLRNQITDG